MPFKRVLNQTIHVSPFDTFVLGDFDLCQYPKETFVLQPKSVSLPFTDLKNCQVNFVEYDPEKESIKQAVDAFLLKNFEAQFLQRVETECHFDDRAISDALGQVNINYPTFLSLFWTFVLLDPFITLFLGNLSGFSTII